MPIEKTLTACDRRQQPLPLCFGAIAQQQRSTLSIGDPMRADRRAGRQQLLGYDVTFEERAVTAAITGRPRHADPAAFAERRRKCGIVTVIEIESGSMACGMCVARNVRMSRRSASATGGRLMSSNRKPSTRAAP
jgi:hypothetical protein